MDEIKEIFGSITKNKEVFLRCSQKLHELAEPSGQEYQSCKLLCDLLEENGFRVERGLRGHETAFRAIFGSGEGFHIGYLCEYDALAGLQQDDVPHPQGNGQYGHGCGHNLLGTGSAAAGIALKELIQSHDLQATVIVYGTPAEETTGGKVSMLKEGYFRDLDVCLGWHPCDHIDCRMVKSKAIVSFTAAFHGVTAHACTCPENGRSALDAAELMSVGCNYLREHVDRDSYIHYCYINGGERPNIVPDFAKVWYCVRAYSFQQAKDLAKRVQRVAQGAAMMTDTSVTFETIGEFQDSKVNYGLSRLAYDCMEKIGAPTYTEEEIAYAKQITAAAGIDKPGAGALVRTIPAVTRELIKENGSSDIANVSQVVPTINLNTTTQGLYSPNHSWAVTVQAQHSAAQKGMFFAAEVLALMGAELILHREKMEGIRRDFQNGGISPEENET